MNLVSTVELHYLVDLFVQHMEFVTLVIPLARQTFSSANAARMVDSAGPTYRNQNHQPILITSKAEQALVWHSVCIHMHRHSLSVLA